MSEHPDHKREGAPRTESAFEKQAGYILPYKGNGGNRIDFDAINAELLGDYLAVLTRWLPNGRREGSEYCVGSLAGEPGDSLKINWRTGVWTDFASGEKGGSDPVSLYAAIHKISQGEAAKRLSGNQAPSPRAQKPTPPNEDGYTPASVTVGEMPKLPLTPEASVEYNYFNLDGDFIGRILRHDSADGKKSFCPYTLWKDKEGRVVWRTKAFEKPRPLYGLRELALSPDRAVLLVEGEKCADIVRKLGIAEIVMAWPGGSNAVECVDWEPLRERRVILWPDADEPGRKCMVTAAGLLAEIGCDVRMVNPPEDVPEGWDIADGIRDGLRREDVLLHVAKAERINIEEVARPVTSTQTVKTIEETNERGSSPEQPTERSVVYYMKQGGKFLWRQKSGQTVLANEETVKRIYRNEENLGASKPELEQFLYKVQTSQALDYAGSMPGYCEGVHSENGQLFYCMEAPVLPKSVPAKGAVFGEHWPVIHKMMRRLFVNDDGETQFWTVLAHLKLAHEGLKFALAPRALGSKRSVRPGQAMAFVGPKNCGKSFFLERVITPLLGGRLVDVFKAFTADAEGFNGEMLKGEVWMIDDQEHSTDIRTRRKLAANLKSKLFGASTAFHAKYQTPVTLKPFGRLFICCNDTPENLSVLPPITEDISDKVHVIRCNKAEMTMPTGTESERQAFRDAVAQELPYFVGELEAWTVPPEITHQRTGVLSYIHPWVEGQLRKQSPEAQLAELILSAFDSGTLHGSKWEGTARELKDQLTAESASCNRDARLLLSGWIAATGTYLSRLAASQADYERDYGLRVVSMGQRKGVERYGLLRLSS
jgi:hypothetical protein